MSSLLLHRAKLQTQDPSGVRAACGKPNRRVSERMLLPYPDAGMQHVGCLLLWCLDISSADGTTMLLV